METTFIYALIDPRTGAIRYVGKADDPEYRLSQHLIDDGREKSYKASWIRSLRAQGLRPLIRIIDEVLGTEWQIGRASCRERV